MKRRILLALCAVPAVPVTLIALAPVLVALPRHPEGASIPAGVGPCDFRRRLTWLIGPQPAWAEAVFALTLGIGVGVSITRRRR